MSLGKLKKVDLRSQWKHEEYDFSTWLAQEENISLLSEEIGIEFADIQTEAKAGRYSVDILAKEEGSERKVVIENQLETTDHDHLGKIITYASGYDAEIIIWIVKDAREEHKQAVSWLNDNTNSKVNIFLIEIELWQINDSPPAPKFNVISKPNDWAKVLKETQKNSELSETKLMQLDFWTQFNQFVADSNSALNVRKPYPQHWHDMSYGSSESHISLTTNTQKKQIACEIYISDSPETYNMLYEKRESIESELGFQIEWRELPKKKASRIIYTKDTDVNDQDEWSNQFKWLKETAEKFALVFKKNLT